MADEQLVAADRSGLDALWEVVDSLRAPTSLTVLGRWAVAIAASARSRYGDALPIAIELGEGEPGSIDTLVDIDGTATETTPVATSRVERAVGASPNQIVFSAPAPSRPGQSPTGRWPSWWDDLFEARGYRADDRLRVPLWEHDGWTHRYIQGLTLYVPMTTRRKVAASSPMPRSAVHPAAYAEAARIAEQATAAMRGGRVVGGFTAWLDSQRQTWSTTTAELNDEVARLGGELERGHRDAAEIEDRLASATTAFDRAASMALRRISHAEHEAALQQRRADAAELELDLVRAEARILGAKLRLRAEQEATAETDADDSSGPWSTLGSRAVGAARRRAERKTLGLAHRAAAAGGPIAKVASRAASILDDAMPRPSDTPSWLFVAEHFLEQLPVLRSHPDPFRAYLERGWQLGGDPHPLFDTEWYLTEHPVERGDDATPIDHYHRIGWRLGYTPHPLFDGNWYLQQYPGVAEAGMNPLWHYIFYGWGERRIPHPLFDTGWYLERYPEVRNAALNPLIHYVTVGWRLGYEPGPMFDAKYYIGRYPDVTSSGRAPWRFFAEVGLHRGDVPSPWAEGFETAAQEVLVEWIDEAASPSVEV